MISVEETQANHMQLFFRARETWIMSWVCWSVDTGGIVIVVVIEVGHRVNSVGSATQRTPSNSMATTSN
jgi:hypothetical protein